jgi:diguanylate cyclase (GGDEF)-like protein
VAAGAADHREERVEEVAMRTAPLTDNRRLQARGLQGIAAATAALAVAAALAADGVAMAELPLVTAALGLLLLAAGLPLALRATDERARTAVVAVLALAPPTAATLAPRPGVLLAAAGLLACLAALSAVVLSPAATLLPLALGAAGFGAAVTRSELAEPLVAWSALLLSLLAVGGVVGHLAQHVRALARTDPVTSVANRGFWVEMVEHETSRSARTTHPLCVAVLVLDDFRQLAFERGHAAADQVLREAAVAWSDQVRSGDLVGRLSADQLAVLLPECGIAAAQLVLERLQRATPPGRTCSAGVAMWDGEEPAGALIDRAADALRLAQRTGHATSRISAA